MFYLASKIWYDEFPHSELNLCIVVYRFDIKIGLIFRKMCRSKSSLLMNRFMAQIDTEFRETSRIIVNCKNISWIRKTFGWMYLGTFAFRILCRIIKLNWFKIMIIAIILFQMCIIRSLLESNKNDKTRFIKQKKEHLTKDGYSIDNLKVKFYGRK